MVTHPQTIDVIVASNMFGDILTDIGSAISGSLGIAPGANIDPERRFPSMYEPIHGSAPDIAGRGIANPIGAILSAALLLRYSLGLEEEARAIEEAVRRTVEEGVLTRDLTGDATHAATTGAVTERVVANVVHRASSD